jgi:hypothetical protein
MTLSENGRLTLRDPQIDQSKGEVTRVMKALARRERLATA